MLKTGHTPEISYNGCVLSPREEDASLLTLLLQKLQYEFLLHLTYFSRSLWGVLAKINA